MTAPPDHARPEPTLVAGLGFPEGLRWHDGELWFSDMVTRRVCSVGADGTVTLRAYVPYQPSGLGWRPDGTLLVSSMLDRAVIAAGPGSRQVVAQLDPYAIGAANDMLVDDQGRAYVGSHGFEPAYAWTGGDFTEQIEPAPLVLVRPDGETTIAAEGLMCANGMALTADRRRLIVAESAANRITIFAVADDGRLTDRDTFAELDAMPDGLCIDEEDAVWVGLLGAERFVRIAEGGEVLDEIATPGRAAVDCALGGPDGRTLYAAVTHTSINVWSDGQVESAIEAHPVAVPLLEEDR